MNACDLKRRDMTSASSPVHCLQLSTQQAGDFSQTEEVNANSTIVDLAFRDQNRKLVDGNVGCNTLILS